MDSEATEVRSDPPSTQILRSNQCGSTSTKKVGYNITRIGQGADYPLRQGEWLLGLKSNVLCFICRLQHGQPPNIINSAPVGLLVQDLTSCRIFGVDEFLGLRVPNAPQLSGGGCPLLLLLVEGIPRGSAVPKKGVMVGGKSIHVALILVEVPPDDLVAEVILAVDLIEEQLYILTLVPVNMYNHAARRG